MMHNNWSLVVASRDLSHEIAIWNRTCQSLPNFTYEESAVKEIVAMKVEELKSELDRRMADRAKEGKVFDNSSSMTDEQVWSHLVMFIVPFLVKRRGAGPQ